MWISWRILRPWHKRNLLLWCDRKVWNTNLEILDWKRQDLALFILMLCVGKADVSEVSDPHVIAGLIKLFFSELPEPLLTFALYDQFILASGWFIWMKLTQTGVDVLEYRIGFLRSLVYSLPRVNRLVLQYLLSLLRRVVKHSDNNLVTTTKISKCFGSLLLKPFQQQPYYATHPNIECPMVVGNLMEHYDRIFLVWLDDTCLTGWRSQKMRDWSLF